MIPIGNAAGWVKTPSDAERLIQLPSDILKHITLGSYTLLERAGNSGNPFWDNQQHPPVSLNALGLPNPGFEKARDFLPGVIRKIHDSGKIAA